MDIPSSARVRRTPPIRSGRTEGTNRWIPSLLRLQLARSGPASSEPSVRESDRRSRDHACVTKKARENSSTLFQLLLQFGPDRSDRPSIGWLKTKTCTSKRVNMAIDLCSHVNMMTTTITAATQALDRVGAEAYSSRPVACHLHWSRFFDHSDLSGSCCSHGHHSNSARYRMPAFAQHRTT